MRNNIIIGVVMFTVGALMCRYLVPPKIKIEEKIITVEKKINVHRTKIIVKSPDGTTTTTIKDDSVIKVDKKEADSITIDTRGNRLNVSGLIGGDTSYKPIYGLIINKQLLGPITVGAWGLSNITGGISVGVNF